MAFAVSYDYRILDHYSAPLRRIQQSTSRFRDVARRTGQAVKGMSGALDKFENKMAGIASAIGGFALLSQYTKFEQTINDTASVVNATGVEMAALKKQAIELGRATRYSAAQVGGAMFELGKSGMDVAKILETTNETLLLASAGGYDLAGSAQIMTKTLKAFNIPGNQVIDTVNRIAGVVNKSQFGMNDYRLAISQGGANAAKAGVSFNEFNAILAATAYAFSSGSDAGTGFSAFLRALKNPTKESLRQMQRYKLAFWDSNNQLRNMSEIVDQLTKKLGPLTERQRGYITETMFGSEAGRFANAVIGITSEQLDTLSKAIQGVSAQKMAETRMQGLVGALTRLGSALQTLNTALFESGLAATFKAFSETAISLASAAATLPRWVLSLAGHLAAVVAVITPLIIGFKLIAPIFAAIGAAAAAVSLPFWAVGAAVAAVVAGLVLLIKKWDAVKAFFAGLPKFLSAGVPVFEAPVVEAEGPGVAAANAKAEQKALAHEISTEIKANGMINGEIRIVAPKGTVQSAAMETQAADLGFNMAGTI